MKQNIFKKLLSYITEIHIESVQSDYNESLQVFLKKGRYQLCTTNAIYSYGDKYDNFKESFDRLNLEAPEVKNVLLLGFGLGSIPFMLEKVFEKKYTYTGVEIDEAVIYLASRYVMDELDSEIELVQADAYAFIHQNHIKYDLICIDIFVDDKIPEPFLTEEFLLEVSDSLSKNGFILFNHLAYYKSDKVAANEYYEDIFIRAFPEAASLDVNKNKMMVSDKSRILKNKIQ
jgi:SAM-dependent methyltransferase